MKTEEVHTQESFNNFNQKLIINNIKKKKIYFTLMIFIYFFRNL